MQDVKINKGYFSDKPEEKWLHDKLDNSFELVINNLESKVIFGFNGIGKTSLSKLLNKYNVNNEFRFLDYDTDIKTDNNIIRIGTHLNEIEIKQNQLENITNALSYKFLTNSVGYKSTKFKNIKDCNNKKLVDIISKDSTQETKLSEKEYVKYVNKYSNIDLKVFFDIVNEVDKVNNITEEINNYKQNILYSALCKINEYLDDKQDTCPVCDSKVDNIKSIVKNKMVNLNKMKSELLSKLAEYGVKSDEQNLELYVELLKEFKKNTNLFNDFVIAGKNIEQYKTINNNNMQLMIINNDLSNLSQAKKNKFNEIKKYEQYFIRDISKYLKLDIKNVLFDTCKDEIIITLPRSINEYSTGERHILKFLCEMYSFMGSDSKTLILDDPVSSLDFINMYKIGYEIVNTKNTTRKNIIVFTHSVELLNIINSQHNNQFKMYYLEYYNKKIYCDKIDYDSKKDVNVISTKQINNANYKLFDSLRMREFGTNIKIKDNESKVYHYDIFEHTSSEDSNLSNYKLIDLIENYRPIVKTDFYTDSFSKILYLVALRVWLEKKLFELIDKTELNIQNEFLNENKLYNKIKVIQKYNLFSKHNISKELIMSKKVMLNQNSHYYSQIMPFSYAINISLDDLDIEIKELKSLFK